MFTRTICCFWLHGQEFSHQNIVATTSSSQTMLPSFLFAKKYEILPSILQYWWKSVGFFSQSQKQFGPKTLTIRPFCILVFFHQSDRPFRPKMQIGPSSSTLSIHNLVHICLRSSQFMVTYSFTCSLTFAGLSFLSTEQINYMKYFTPTNMN